MVKPTETTSNQSMQIWRTQQQNIPSDDRWGLIRGRIRQKQPQASLTTSNGPTRNTQITHGHRLWRKRDHLRTHKKMIPPLQSNEHKIIGIHDKHPNPMLQVLSATKDAPKPRILAVRRNKKHHDDGRRIPMQCLEPRHAPHDL